MLTGKQLKNELEESLLAAAGRADATTVRELLNNDVSDSINVNATDAQGRTALHYLAASTLESANSVSAAAVVQLLVRHGANIDAHDTQGQTPLDVAKNQTVIEALSVNGAYFSSENQSLVKKQLSQQLGTLITRMRQLREKEDTLSPDGLLEERKKYNEDHRGYEPPSP